IRDDPRMARFHLYGAVRGDVLRRLGRYAEAAEELERAAGLAPTPHERRLLLPRAPAVNASPSRRRPLAPARAPLRGGIVDACQRREPTDPPGGTSGMVGLARSGPTVVVGVGGFGGAFSGAPQAGGG